MGACLQCFKANRSNGGKTSSSSSPFKIAELPMQLREKIWRCLDGHSKKCVRQVCSMFKNEIDLAAGLAVRVDDSSQINLNFVRSVEVKQAVIINMGKHPPKNLFRTPINVEYLETMCSVTPIIFSNLIMPLSENLLSLSFLSDSLMHSNIITLESSPPDSGNNMKDFNIKTFTFPRLIALEIHYGSFPTRSLTEQVANAFKPRANSLPKSGQTLEVFNANMKIIMKSFSCPRLMSFAVHPDHAILLAMSNNPNQVPKQHVEWENSTLKYFIHKHRSTLRILDVFLYARDIDEDYEQYTDYPVLLTDFIIVIPFVAVAKRLNHKCFWKETVLNCTRLSRLILQVEFWRNYDDFFKILPGILSKNLDTLTTIRLESFSAEEEESDDITSNYRRNSAGFTLNFGLFNVCQRLKNLEIIQLNAKKYFVATGFINLPRTLQRLEVKRIFIPSEELYFLRELPELKRVSLYHVGASGVFGVNYKALKKLWGNDALEYLQVCSFNFENNEDKMKQIIKKSQQEKRKEFDVNVQQTVIMLRQNVLKLVK